MRLIFFCCLMLLPLTATAVGFNVQLYDPQNKLPSWCTSGDWPQLNRVIINNQQLVPMNSDDPLSSDLVAGFMAQFYHDDNLLIQFPVSLNLSVGSFLDPTQQVFLGPGRLQTQGGFCTSQRVDWLVNMTEARRSNPAIRSEVCAYTFFSPCLPSSSKLSSRAQCSGPCCITALSTYDSWISCLQAFPLTDARKADVLDAVSKTLQSYVYSDINIDSGPPADIRADWRQALSTFAAKDYTYEYQLHQDLSLLFSSFHDLHTNYQSCLSAELPKIGQPFSLGSEIDNNQQMVFITNPGILTDFPFDLSDFPFDPWDFDRWRVLSIDGTPVIDYLVEWGNRYSAFKDPGARFNDALSNWNSRSSDLPPASAALVLELQHPTTFQVVTVSSPWLWGVWVDVARVNEVCGEVAQKELSSTDFASEQSSHRANIRSVVSYPNSILESTGPLFGLRLSAVSTDTNTGVLGFGSFIASQQSPIEAVVFFRNALHIFHTLAVHRYGFRNLIVDVSGNPGGYISLIAYAVQYLGNLHTTEVERMDYRTIHSPLSDDLVSWYSSLNTTQQQFASSNNIVLQLAAPKDLASTGQLADPPAGWYFPGVSIRYGGKVSLYSELFDTTPSPDLFFSWFLNQAQQAPYYVPYAERNILILSNGFCVSSCSFFVRQMRHFRASKVLAYGGIANQPMAPDVAAASVITYQDIAAVRSLTFNPIFADNPVPTSNLPSLTPAINAMSIAWMAAYFRSQKDVRPLEFIPFPADFRLDVWEADHWGTQGATSAWVAATPYFDCCFAWEGPSRECPPCLDESAGSLTYSASILSLGAAMMAFLLGL